MSAATLQSKIDPRFIEALDRWVQRGILPGDFLQAVLRNDLTEAINRADDEAITQLKAIVQYIYNYCPRGCHGDKAALTNWATDKGYQGIEGLVWDYTG